MPTVSVIIAAYNAARYIEEALTSVVEQDFRDVEVIVVDDGSTDQSLELARRASLRDVRVRVIALPHWGRPAIVRNVGIAAASGDLLTFLDADDRYLPERLEALVAVFKQHKELDLVFHDYYRTDISGNVPAVSYLAELKYLTHARGFMSRVDEALYIANDSFFGFAASGISGVTTNSLMVRR
jgi:glycosyltransferase involved in cell wall biosynthesis